MMPRFTSGWLSIRFLPTTRAWQAIENSAPPPITGPSTAATSGFDSRDIFIMHGVGLVTDRLATAFGVRQRPQAP
jgi:hypothetical protein